MAIWIENPDQSVAADLAVWYDVAKKNNEGTEWLKDMRQWWRRSGRNQQFPVDGVSGATKPAGKHALAFNGAAKPLASSSPASTPWWWKRPARSAVASCCASLPMAAAEAEQLKRAASMSWAPSRWT